MINVITMIIIIVIIKIIWDFGLLRRWKTLKDFRDIWLCSLFDKYKYLGTTCGPYIQVEDLGRSEHIILSVIWWLVLTLLRTPFIQWLQTRDELSQYKNEAEKSTILHVTVHWRFCIFWDETPCSSLKVNWRFGGKYYLHLQGWRISQAVNQHETGSKHSPNVKELYNFMSQKMELFVTTA
jgi:hypothetical protein